MNITYIYYNIKDYYLNHSKKPENLFCLETAHPAKFAETIYKILRRNPKRAAKRKYSSNAESKLEDESKKGLEKEGGGVYSWYGRDFLGLVTYKTAYDNMLENRNHEFLSNLEFSVSPKSSQTKELERLISHDTTFFNTIEELHPMCMSIEASAEDKPVVQQAMSGPEADAWLRGNEEGV